MSWRKSSLAWFPRNSSLGRHAGRSPALLEGADRCPRLVRLHFTHDSGASRSAFPVDESSG